MSAVAGIGDPVPFVRPCLQTGIADAGYNIGVVDSPLKP